MSDCYGGPSQRFGTSDIAAPVGWAKLNVYHPADEEETTIKVASSKDKASGKERQLSIGIIKLKKPTPKHSKSGNWKDGSTLDGSRPLPPPRCFPYAVLPQHYAYMVITPLGPRKLTHLFRPNR